MRNQGNQITQKPLQEFIVDPNITPHEKEAILSGESSVSTLTVLNDGRLASGGYKEIKVWNVQTQSCEATLSEHGFWVCALTQLADGRLASGSREDHNMIKVWNVQTQTCETTLSGHGSSALTVLSDGRLASGSGEGYQIELWNIETKRCEATLSGHWCWIEALNTLSDGRLASASIDRTIKLWNVQTGDCEATLSGHTHNVLSLTQLPDGRLASGSYKEIKVWNVQTQSCEATLSEDFSNQALTVLPDGRLASGGYDNWSNPGNTIKVWNVETQVCEATLSGHTASVFALTVLPDGRLVSGSGDNTIKFWDMGLRPVLTANGAVTFSEDEEEAEVARRERVRGALKAEKLPQQPHIVMDDVLQASVTPDEFTSMQRMLIEQQTAKLPTHEDLASEIETIELHILKIRSLSPAEQTAFAQQMQQYEAEAQRLKERYTIENDSVRKTYYHLIQTRISELRVASIGIASGYLDVNKSQMATTVGWVCSALSSLFPGVSAVTTIVKEGVTCLDARYREYLLKKVHVFGHNITESEKLVEEIARLLVRAHYHAGHVFSNQQADKDAQALIQLIVKANPSYENGPNLAVTLVSALFSTKPILEPLPTSDQILPSAITQDEFTALQQAVVKQQGTKPTPEELANEIQALERRIAQLSSLSLKDQAALGQQMQQYRAQALQLKERYTIESDPARKAYYHLIQTRISELMVASLGVGSGYLDVNKSQLATTVGWICSALSSVLPGVSIVTTVVNAGVTRLDKHYREYLLKKVRIFGHNITESEKLAEEIARLLVRAHYHAGHVFSRQQADKDAQALIQLIITAKPAYENGPRLNVTLVTAILGGTPNLNPLPIIEIVSQRIRVAISDHPLVDFNAVDSVLSVPIITRDEFLSWQRAVLKQQTAKLPTKEDLAAQIERVETRIIKLRNLSKTEQATLASQMQHYQEEAKQLKERYTIESDPARKAYYHLIQAHISELMVVSLGIGGGYLDVNSSQMAKGIGFVCNALSSVFPGVSTVTTIVKSGVTCLDTQYREYLLKKVRVFGHNITESEKLAEEIARLLVRAHYHAGHVFSNQQADKDAQALIGLIVKANPPYENQPDLPLILVTTLFGSKQNIDRLPITYVGRQQQSNPKGEVEDYCIDSGHKKHSVNDKSVLLTEKVTFSNKTQENISLASNRASMFTTKGSTVSNSNNSANNSRCCLMC